MTKILVFGHAPLPFENTQRGFAPGKRTWQFVKPLLDRGHEVCLIASRIPNTYPADIPSAKTQTDGNLTYHSLDEQPFRQRAYIQEVLHTFKPECVIGVTILPAFVAAQIDLDVPFWADIYGSTMAEAQMKARVYRDDFYLSHFWQMVYPVLTRADVFSTVSVRQKYALIGELAACSRLNQWAAGYDFAHVIPAGGETGPYQKTKSVIRGILADDDHFVILYSGGFNTWTDVETLFAGVEGAMQKNDRIRFVATGGSIGGHDDRTYPRFQQLINESPHRSRFHLMGWLPWEEVHNYYLESDIGIIADKFCYEAILGSRTRVLDWLRAELPIVSTSLAEVVEYLAEQKVAFIFPAGDSQALADQLLRLADSPKLLEEARSQCRKVLTEQFAIEETVTELVDWVENPSFAPDRKHALPSLLRSPLQEKAEPEAKNQIHTFYDFWQPVWQAFIYSLYHSQRFSFLIRPLMKISARIKSKRKAAYQVEYKNPQIDTHMVCGQSTHGTITLSNGGRETWHSAQNSETPISISYHWYRDGQLVLWEGESTPLEGDVGPGASLTADFLITTPADPGNYTLEIDLYKEKVAWFSEMGLSTYPAPVVVDEN